MPPDARERADSRQALHGIAYVFERFPTFTQTFCFREVLAVRERGIEPLVFSIRTPKGEPFQNFPAGLCEETVYVPADLSGALRSLTGVPFQARATVALWRLIKAIPDRHRAQEAAWLGHQLRKAGVIHIHTHFAGIGARTAWWIKKFYGIGFSFTAHANDVFCEDAESPVTREKLFRDAAFVVTVSDYSVRWLRQKYPQAAGKIHRVYNGIDLGKFHTSVPDPKAPLILSIGRYIAKKGFPDLVAACAQLGNRNFRCLIVGQGPMEEELKTQVAKLGLEGRVEITGPRSEAEIIELLSQTTLFALPCIDAGDEGRDNLPTVLMEAMAAGVPCVSTAVAGVPEMVRDGVTGLIVPENDPASLATAMGRLLDEPDIAKEMGKNGRVLAEENFALEKTSSALCELWRSHGIAN